MQFLSTLIKDSTLSDDVPSAPYVNIRLRMYNVDKIFFLNIATGKYNNVLRDMYTNSVARRGRDVVAQG